MIDGGKTTPTAAPAWRRVATTVLAALLWCSAITSAKSVLSVWNKALKQGTYQAYKFQVPPASYDITLRVTRLGTTDPLPSFVLALRHRAFPSLNQYQYDRNMSSNFIDIENVSSTRTLWQSSHTMFVQRPYAGIWYVAVYHDASPSRTLTQQIPTAVRARFSLDVDVSTSNADSLAYEVPLDSPAVHTLSEENYDSRARGFLFKFETTTSTARVLVTALADVDTIVCLRYNSLPLGVHAPSDTSERCSTNNTSTVVLDGPFIGTWYGLVRPPPSLVVPENVSVYVSESGCYSSRSGNLLCLASLYNEKHCHHAHKSSQNTHSTTNRQRERAVGGHAELVGKL